MSLNKRKVFVIGIGQTKFEKPGRRENWDYPDMVKESVGQALSDCKLSYKDIQQAVAGYIYGNTCMAQRALYGIGMTGIPIYNVNNACASGSSGILMMKQFIESGSTDCGLAVGFEKMARGSLDSQAAQWMDRAQPVEAHVNVVSETYGLEASPIMAQLFGNAGREHMEKYGSKPEHFAKIAVKNHKHSVNNSLAQFQTEYTLEQVMKSKKIHHFLTMLQCSPTSDGSAAVVLCSEKFLREHPHLKAQAVEILGMQIGTDFPSSFEKSNIKMVGSDVIVDVSKKLYKETGLTVHDCQLVECHDCFSPNELITYEALGMCPIGKGHELVDRCDNTYGGKWVVNPSGGLISKGHPIGATGVAQCVELCKHLRGIAGKRQVPNARVGLQHNIGIGGAGVVAMYKLAFPAYPDSKPVSQQQITSGPEFKSDNIFSLIRDRVNEEGRELATKVASSFRFVITGGPGGATKKWVIDTKSSPVFVGEKEGPTDCEITISDDNFIALVDQKLKPESAFMQGKMKLKGNMAKAMKLRSVLDAARVKAKL